MGGLGRYLYLYVVHDEHSGNAKKSALRMKLKMKANDGGLYYMCECD
jgi:hypothetical protein